MNKKFLYQLYVISIESKSYVINNFKPINKCLKLKFL